jgi:hypothetical protein
MHLALAAKGVLKKRQLALIVDSEGQGVVLEDAEAIIHPRAKCNLPLYK